jgi:L,D-transpeptidase YcbB
MTRTLVAGLLAAGALSVACGRAEKRATEAAAALRQAVETSPPREIVAGGPSLWKTERLFYERRQYAPAWLKDGRPTEAAQALRQAVQRAPEEGLDPAEYDLGPLGPPRDREGRREDGQLEPRAAAEADLRLTHAFLKYASHLVAGRVDPRKVDGQWFGQVRTVDLGQVLEGAVRSGQVGPALDPLRPLHPQYAALKQALQRYREIAQRGGWPTGFGRLADLRRGGHGPGVSRLRARLVASGDLPPSAAAGDVFDETLAEALRRFERHHGLPEEARLGPGVVAALDVPVEERIRQIELNLERWRWLPENLGDRYVLVNVPSFQLDAYEGTRAVLTMRVVAGERDKPTPIFSDRMTEVVFSPYWRVPPSIAKNEIIPAILRDPGYLAKANLEVVKGEHVLDASRIDWTDPDPNVRIRQRPGVKNSLGLVKFVFPNQFDVYLHDTPADSLFQRLERDLSHGCVRVEKPVDLARWVLADTPEWTPERIETAMNSGHEQHVAIKRPVPVYILYQTAWVEPDGSVDFRDDLYGHDQAQIRYLPRSPMLALAPTAAASS